LTHADAAGHLSRRRTAVAGNALIMLGLQQRKSIDAPALGEVIENKARPTKAACVAAAF